MHVPDQIPVQSRLIKGGIQRLLIQKYGTMIKDSVEFKAIGNPSTDGAQGRIFLFKWSNL